MGALSPRLVLVGMMGAGKTTVGRHLARVLGWPFVDADRELEARCGVSIATLFEVEGEGAFRQREAALLDELSQRQPLVLATGGGAVLRADSRALLHQRALVVYLRAGVDEIVRRTAQDRSRPLLQTADPRARIAALLAEREPLYDAVAHVRVDSVAGNPRRLVQRILADPLVQARVAVAP